ncbi:MAG: class I SAM-dependent methyltransferase [Chloroflexaceae bacterium]|nr:class I SAM-dependent methyltransferase [Chloroflexaceae bacterium]
MMPGKGPGVFYRVIRLARQTIGVVWKEAFQRHVGFWEHRSGTRYVLPHVPLPPAHLRARIGSATSIGSFLSIGKTTCQHLEQALEPIGTSLGSFRSILDFGCGCGRTLVWLANWPDGSQHQHEIRDRRVRLVGTDVDTAAIAWCRRHLPFAEFYPNQPMPPLPFPSATFDLVYTISVLPT